MSKKADSIAYCGLYCGGCPAYTQSLANLSKAMQKELHRSKCDKAAKGLSKIPVFVAFKHYNKFEAILECLTKMRCVKTCRAGGGCPTCRIRKCVIEKNFDGCWECDEFEKCKTLNMLGKYGEDKGYIQNIRKIKRNGIDAFIRTKKAHTRIP